MGNCSVRGVDSTLPGFGDSGTYPNVRDSSVPDYAQRTTLAPVCFKCRCAEVALGEYNVM